jgi:hypothetical protein
MKYSVPYRVCIIKICIRKTTTTSPLRSRWNIGPQQLSVAEVSVAFKFFIETGLLALCSSPQPGGFPYLCPLETGWPSYTPRHRVPILVAFYDMWPQWDYSFPQSPHGDIRKKSLEKCCKEFRKKFCSISFPSKVEIY